MRADYYILQDGILKRKENTVYFVNENEKRVLPINKIYSIYAYGRLSFSSGVVSYLSKNVREGFFFFPLASEPYLPPINRTKISAASTSL